MKIVNVLLSLLLLVACAGFAAAADQPQAQSPATDTVPVELQPAAPGAGCAVGNLAAPSYVYGNWITGNDAG